MLTAFDIYVYIVCSHVNLISVLVSNDIKRTAGKPWLFLALFDTIHKINPEVKSSSVRLTFYAEPKVLNQLSVFYVDG